MAAVQDHANYFTKHLALTTNNITTVYTCGDQGELAFDLTGLMVAATTANSDTCSLYVTNGGTDWVLVYKGVVEADFPLQLEGLPVHLAVGDIIKATATTGATYTLHVHMSGLKTTRSPGSDSRRG